MSFDYEDMSLENVFKHLRYHVKKDKHATMLVNIADEQSTYYINEANKRVSNLLIALERTKREREEWRLVGKRAVDEKLKLERKIKRMMRK